VILLDRHYLTVYSVCQTAGTLNVELQSSEGLNTLSVKLFQAESVRDAAFGCEWVGSPIPFQRCLMFIITTANKGFHLTAGKFVPVSNLTTLNVCN
jgi:hypothetical protein